MWRKPNREREIEKVKESVRKEAAPTIERVDRVREDHLRIKAQMAREWQLIRGEG
jgi:hypothetical protein